MDQPGDADAGHGPGRHSIEVLQQREHRRGHLSTVTKSGTNEFHGDVFEFYRNTALNAKTIFQTTKPDYHRHQVGGALGGPIVKNKAQFFMADEYTNEANFYTVNTRGIFPSIDGTYNAPVWNHMIVGRVDDT